MKTVQTLDKTLARLVPEWGRLFKALKTDISDGCRASDDPDDNTPSMQVTIGFTPESEGRGASWSYQTGDNSYAGGAYCHPHWAVVTLTRRSNSLELANGVADQLAEVCAEVSND